jgi:hypothetical protein
MYDKVILEVHWRIRTTRVMSPPDGRNTVTAGLGSYLSSDRATAIPASPPSIDLLIDGDNNIAI